MNRPIDMIRFAERAAGLAPAKPARMTPEQQALADILVMESRLVHLTGLAARNQFGMGPALELITTGLNEARELVEMEVDR